MVFQQKNQAKLVKYEDMQNRSLGGTQVIHCFKKRKHYVNNMTIFVLHHFTKIIHKYYFFQNKIIIKQVWDKLLKTN